MESRLRGKTIQPLSGAEGVERMGNKRLAAAIKARLPKETETIWLGRCMRMVDAVCGDLRIDLLRVPDLRPLFSLNVVVAQAMRDPSPALTGHLLSIPGFPTARLDPNFVGPPEPFTEAVMEQHGYLQQVICGGQRLWEVQKMVAATSAIHPDLGIEFYALPNAALRSAAIAAHEAKGLAAASSAGFASGKRLAL